MLFLFREPQIHQQPDVRRSSAKPFRIMRNETCRSAPIPKLKLLERGQNASNGVQVHCDRRLPIRFGTIESVSKKMINPVGRVHSPTSILCYTDNFAIQSMWTVPACQTFKQAAL